MSDILKICGIAIIATVLSAFLKVNGQQISKYITQISSILIITSVIISLTPIIDLLRKSINNSAFSLDVLPIIVKSAAIAVICQVVSDICKELGETMLSNAVEFAGNASIVLLSVPVINSLLTDVFKLLRS